MSRIPDTHVDHALDVLKSTDHATARAAYEFAEKHLKVVLAHAEGQSNAKSKGDRESEALRSNAYERALSDYKLVAENYYRCKDRRDAASSVLDAWRTQSSDQRAMLKVV